MTFTHQINSMKYLLTILSLTFLMSCATTTKSKYSKIEYEAGACFGFCPIFKITINPDRTAVIEAERFTFTEGRTKDDMAGEKEGTFKATIKEADYQLLLSKLDSLDFKNLKDYYGNKNITDLPTSYLNITFMDGTKKRIEDYGKGGTEQLDELYQIIEDLRKSQVWTKVN